MLFDFRIRPPFKSFFTTGGMFGGHDGSHDPAYIDPYETGKDPIPSADKGDMELFFQEMEANGIGNGRDHRAQLRAQRLRRQCRHPRVHPERSESLFRLCGH